MTITQHFPSSTNPFDRWLHIATTWDRKTFMANLYIDGTLVHQIYKYDVSDIDVIPTHPNNEYFLGSNWNGYRMKGWISDFVVFQTPLDKSMINKLKGKKYNF